MAGDGRGDDENERELVGDATVFWFLAYAEAGVVGDLKIGVDRLASAAGEERPAQGKSELAFAEFREAVVGGSNAVLTHNSSGQEEIEAR